ncbi:MAG: cation-translocating P-type ATPase [Oscillospiraceae bacterium]|nr:cation-translocating P-type ATPase [Oscillospiraceae bacterium]
MEVENSRKNFGTNSLPQPKSATFWEKYWKNLDDPIITVLLITLGINILFVFLGKVDWYEAGGILLAVLISTFVSTFSEYKNEGIFEKIQEKAGQKVCKVYRGGELLEIPIEDIVVGDLVWLCAGDIVPADGMVVDGSIMVDQSSLNGENDEIEKSNIFVGGGVRNVPQLPPSDFLDKFSVFRGSVVQSGECVAQIKAVGAQTVYGSMTHELGHDERKSPLIVKLTNLAKGISRFGYIVGISIIVLYMFRAAVIYNNFDPYYMSQYFLNLPQVLSDLVEAVILGIIIIVVAVPEGLPLMIAIVCSLNMNKMFKDNVLVRKLVGIETAGSLNMLFTDKTGTLTHGKLEVISFTTGAGRCFSKFSDLSGELKNILHISILHNNEAKLSGGIMSTPRKNYVNKPKIIGGNSTDKSLMEYISGKRCEIEVEKVSQTLFDSDKKFSSCRVTGDYNLSLIKGAPEVVLSRCKYYYDVNGAKVKISDMYTLNNEVDKLAKRAVRVIALAASEEPLDGDIMPNNLTLVGLIGIRDEIRREVPAAIAEVQSAGITVVMITGDRAETAAAIAKETGILGDSDDLVLTSSQLAQMRDDKVKEILPRIRVIARALPSDKSRLVRLAQELNLVVGMTGDGVNDSPALKRADVGFAMGSGTDVAIGAGDIVILDDNFLSIKRAILYGRTIYNNIKKFITFQLTINVAAVTVSLFAPMVGIARPLSITQMLWINLVMDALAAIAFGSEPSLAKYMKEKPKSRDESIIDRKMWSAILWNGAFIFIVSMIMFTVPGMLNLFRVSVGDIYFYTGYFTFFIFACIFNAFNARATGTDFFEHIAANKNFIYVMLLIAVVQVFMTYYGGVILRTQGLIMPEWIVVISLAVLIIPFDMVRKMVFKRSAVLRV